MAGHDSPPFTAAALLAFVGLFLAGCDECDLEGRSYRSETDLECGLTPTGTASCPWTIAFREDGTFVWRHSDLEEFGPFRCEDGAITGDSDLFDNQLSGTLEDDGSLLWEGQRYLEVTTDGS